MYQPLLYSKRFKHHFMINIKVSPILTEWTNVTLSTCCRARLLLLSAQVSKFHFQSLNSETKGAELMLKSQCTHHPQLLKAGSMMFFTLIQLTNQTKDIFHLKFPFSKFQDSWQMEILPKLSLFEVDSKAALARFRFQSWKQLCNHQSLFVKT